ncbi:MAG: hypothetical protein JSS66_08225 [Armatimonadetes bacterium]|nr:hypothetical protein [Armatimonadota bacterium]
MQTWRVCLFGPLRIEGEGATIDRFETKRSAQIIARLALARNSKMLRADLADLLWPEDFYDATRVRLRQELSRLRRALGRAADILVADQDTVSLDRSAVEVDVSEFDAEVRGSALAPDEDTRAEKLVRAAQTSEETLLPGWDELWVAAERERLTAARLTVLTELAEAQNSRGDHAQALTTSNKALAIDRCNERAHMAAMTAHGGLGSMTDALGQFQQMKRLLREEQGREPTAVAEQLAESIRAGVSTVTEVATSRITAHFSVPIPTDTFFGRGVEVESLIQLLSSESTTRLVTLLAIGGMGKTRLAIEAALRIESSSALRCHFVPLAGLASADEVSSHVLETLAVHTQQAASAASVLTSLVPPTGLLLVLDNMEHILPEAAKEVSKMLEQVPNLKVLCTSRVPLRISGERLFQVEPLAIGPDSEAVLLLSDQACSVRPNIQFGPSAGATLQEIVRRLDGIPLAIRIAASKLRVLSPQQLLTQIEERFTDLENRSADAPERHRTLQSAFQWTFDSLPAPALALLTTMSGFHGGWTLEMATAASEEPDVIGSVETLCDHSLLVIEDSGAALRFDILQSVREHVEQSLDHKQLAERDSRRTKAVHDWMLKLSPNPNSNLPLAAVEAIDRELENIRAALHQAGSDDCRAQLEIAVRMPRYWRVRGHANEGLAILGALGENADSKATDLSADIAFAVGFLHQATLQFEESFEHLEQARALYREEGRIHAEALALSRIALVHRSRGDFETVRSTFGEAMALALSSGDSGTIGNVALLQGYSLYYSADLEGAWSSLEVARAELVSEDDPFLHVSLAHLEAWTQFELGDIALAEQRMDEVERLPDEIGDIAAKGSRSELRGRMAFAQDRADAAVAHFETALQAWQMVGSLFQACDQRASLGRALASCGRFEEARDNIRQAYEGWRALSDTGGGLVAIHSLVHLVCCEGDLERAAKILGASAARADAGAMQFIRSEQRFVKALEATLTAGLGKERASALMTEGRGWSDTEWRAALSL